LEEQVCRMVLKYILEKMGWINVILNVVAKWWRPVTSTALKLKQSKSASASYLNCQVLATCDIYGVESETVQKC